MDKNIITFSRDFFYSIKKNLEYDNLEDLINIFSDIDDVLKIVKKTKDNKLNWRKPRSKIIKDNISNEDKIYNEINGFLNKLSPSNFEKMNDNIVKICIENKKIKSLLDKIIDNIFLKAVMQCTYCPYYVKLINNLLKNDVKIGDIIDSKCIIYQNMLQIEIKDSESLTQSEKETYDEFCEKIKNKTYKAGYSQFIGELFNNKIINSEIVESCLKLFLDNLEKSIKGNELEYIEDNLICICNLLTTCGKTLKYTIISFVNIKDQLNCVRKESNLPKRLKFKIMDLLDSFNK